MKGVLCGVDVGSTRVKAVVVDLDGTAVASGTAATPWVVDGPHVEMDANALADVVRQVLADAAAGLDVPVLGVGVTGMAESGVLVDRRGEPASPIIAWHDQRGDVDRIARELPDLSRHTGVLVDPVASIFKLPLLLAGTTARRWLNVAEWVVHALGGEQFAEMSLAGRTGLQELRSGRWWDDALSLLGVDASLLPGEARLGVEGAGTATFAPIAGARLAVAGHDHQVAAFAARALEPGCLLESLGTADALALTFDAGLDAAVLDAAVDDLTANRMTVGRTVVPDRLITIIGLRTGQVLGRVARLLGVADDARAGLAAAAAERTPDPALRVTLDGGELTIAGVGDGTDAADLWRAAVGAADARAAEVVAVYARHFGRPREVVVGGGWLRDVAVAAAIDRRFPGARRTRHDEPGAVGAAATAGIAAGVLAGPFDEKPTGGGR